MKQIHKTSIQFTAVAVLGIAGGVHAQDGAAAKQKPEYCSTSKIVGAEVRIQPGAEAKREAEKAQEPAEKPKGKIADVLVDVETGALDTAIIEFGGFIGIGDKSVAVPFSALTWNQAHERFELAASEDRLVALPTFDVGKAKKEGMDAARGVALSHWRTAARTEEATGPIGETKEASAKKGPDAKPVETKPVEVKGVDGTKFFTLPGRYACVTEVDDFPVYATNEKVGAISDLFVERGKATIALAVLKQGGTLGMGGTEYLVPFRTLRFCSNGDERVLCMNCSAAELQTAVVYEKPKNGVVDEEAAKRALASHTFEKDKSKAEHRDREGSGNGNGR